MEFMHQDVDFHNAILFSRYVMVLLNGKMIGGGLVEAFNDTHVTVGRECYVRGQVNFVVTLPPQCNINNT